MYGTSGGGEGVGVESTAPMWVVVEDDDFVPEEVTGGTQEAAAATNASAAIFSSGVSDSRVVLVPDRKGMLFGVELSAEIGLLTFELLLLVTGLTRGISRCSWRI